MEKGQGNETAHESEVLQVIRVHWGVGIYLQGEIVSTGVFEQTVHGIQELIREIVEPLSEKKEKRKMSNYRPSNTTLKLLSCYTGDKSMRTKY